MERNISEEYKKLQHTRVLLNPVIIDNKKRRIRDYFSDYLTVNMSNLNKKMNDIIILYKAPLKEIHGSNMTNWPTGSGEEIYIDKDFLANGDNAGIIKQQLTHEVLHSLCRIDNKSMIFNHKYDSNTEYLVGINEAVTQMFTDDVEKSELSEEEDYLYFTKNIMRVIGNVIGMDILANQYLNYDSVFENKFNELTENKFDDFAFILNTIHTLSKKKHYGSITSMEEGQLTSCQDIILSFTSRFVEKSGEKNSIVYSIVNNGFKNKDFLSKLNLEQLNKIGETK